jgi:hypothetical protein
MKKSLFSAFLLFLVFSCVTETEDTIFFNSATSDKEVKLSNDMGSPVCAVHLQLQYATEKNGHKAEVVNEIIQKKLLDMSELTIQQAIDSFANSYTSSYIRNFLPLYNQDRADTTKRSWYEYHYVITSETHPGGFGTTSYIAIIDYFEGGAHGVNQRMTMNFENKTGRLLELQDIFVPGFESQLNPILQKALTEKVGAKDYRDLQDKGYLFQTKMFPSKNFLLSDETITFIYNPYEIASYDKGETELNIALSALDSILKSEYKQ